MSASKSPMFDNALAALRVAVADYLSDEPDRIGASVRNLTTGLLLLCKEKLARLSPDGELLIWKRLVPVPNGNGGVTLAGAGRQTVDVFEIKERLTRFGVAADFKRLTDVADIRNQLEHHYAKKSPQQVRETFVDGFHFLHDFLPKHLDTDPRDALGALVWQALTKNAQIHAELLARCRESFAAIDWAIAPARLQFLLTEAGCPSCGSSLVMQDAPKNRFWNDITLACQVCAHDGDHHTWAVETLARVAKSDRYAEAADGHDFRICACARCHADAFWIAAQQCQACGYKDAWVSQDEPERNAKGQLLCHNCDGSGWYPPNGNGDQCETCAGQGWFAD